MSADIPKGVDAVALELTTPVYDCGEPVNDAAMDEWSKWHAKGYHAAMTGQSSYPPLIMKILREAWRKGYRDYHDESARIALHSGWGLDD